MKKNKRKVRVMPETPYKILLEICKRVYRKHVLSDDAIGWEDLSDELGEVLCEQMGCANFNKWVDSQKHYTS